MYMRKVIAKFASLVFADNIPIYPWKCGFVSSGYTKKADHPVGP